MTGTASARQNGENSAYRAERKNGLSSPKNGRNNGNGREFTAKVTFQPKILSLLINFRLTFRSKRGRIETENKGAYSIYVRTKANPAYQ